MYDQFSEFSQSEHTFVLDQETDTTTPEVTLFFLLITPPNQW